jgi:hypothetical protein
MYNLIHKTSSFATCVKIYTFPIYIAVNNRNLFHTNSELHDENTSQIRDLHLPFANLVIYQRLCTSQVYRFFYSFPANIKKFSNNLRTIKRALKYFYT